MSVRVLFCAVGADAGDGDAAELLKRLLADAARVIGGAAGGDDYGFYTPQCLVVKSQLLKFYAAAAETGLERGADGAAGYVLPSFYAPSVPGGRCRAGAFYSVYDNPR